MNTKKLLALLLTVVMLVGIMAACAPKAPEEPTPETDATPEAVSEAFDMAVCLASEPKTIDPALNTAVDGAIMIQHFFEGLKKWVDDGNGNATLADGQATIEDKTVNDDGTVTYTFKMREGALWSDGTPVTANDFVYSWKRLADPATAAEYNSMIDMVLGFDEVAYGVPTGEFETVVDEETGEETQKEIVEYADPSTLAVSAPDDSTFVVTLKNDCPYFDEICAFPATYPVRKDIIESAGGQWTFDTATYIGNGPYKMGEWVHNSYIKAVPNENYYDVEKLGPDSITFQLMDDANAMYTSFKSGTLNFIEEVPTDEVATLLANGELNVVPYIGTYFVCFNNKVAPFDDARVREAFSLVIDRNYMVEKIKQTGELPASAYVPYGVYDAEGLSGDDFRTVGGEYYSVSEEDYQANCERARELLAEAGYPNGEGFPAIEYLYNTNDDHKAIGEALQQMWKTELGVDVVLTNQDWAVFIENRQNGNYQIARHAWIADYNDPCTFIDMWVTGAGNNDADYSNAEYDAYVAAAKATVDPAERMKNFHAAEDLLMGENAIAPIYFYTQRYMLSEDIQGLYYTPLGYFLFSYCTKG